MKTGFIKFLNSLKLYLVQQTKPKIIFTDISEVKIYGSVTLENGAIVRATNKYYNKPWFSNISVYMHSDELFQYTTDQGICYGRVCFLLLNTTKFLSFIIY